MGSRNIKEMRDWVDYQCKLVSTVEWMEMLPWELLLLPTNALK